MDWYLKGRRRGISWKDRTLESISSPPTPLLVIFGLVVLLLYFATTSDYKAHVERTMTGFKVFLFLLPVILILVVHSVMGSRWFYYIRGVVPTPYDESTRLRRQDGGGSSGWLVAVVLLLLVLVYFQTYVHSTWFRRL